MEIKIRCGGHPCLGGDAYIYENHRGEVRATTTERYNREWIGTFAKDGLKNGWATIELSRKVFRDVQLEDGRIVDIELAVKVVGKDGKYIEED